MPYDDPDPTDPMTLHGIAIETEDDSAVREMAECFIEEYGRMGFEGDRILGMFNTRGYVGPYMAWQTLGDAAIRAMIEEIVQKRGPGRRPRAYGGSGDVSLPVLD